MTQQAPLKTARQKVWKRPELRKLGTLNDLVRTQQAGEQRLDQIVDPYYFVS